MTDAVPFLVARRCTRDGRALDALSIDATFLAELSATDRGLFATGWSDRTIDKIAALVRNRSGGRVPAHTIVACHSYEAVAEMTAALVQRGVRPLRLGPSATSCPSPFPADVVVTVPGRLHLLLDAIGAGEFAPDLLVALDPRGVLPSAGDDPDFRHSAAECLQRFCGRARVHGVVCTPMVVAPMAPSSHYAARMRDVLALEAFVFLETRSFRAAGLVEIEAQDVVRVSGGDHPLHAIVSRHFRDRAVVLLCGHDAPAQLADYARAARIAAVDLVVRGRGSGAIKHADSLCDRLARQVGFDLERLNQRVARLDGLDDLLPRLGATRTLDLLADLRTDATLLAATTLPELRAAAGRPHEDGDRPIVPVALDEANLVVG